MVDDAKLEKCGVGGVATFAGATVRPVVAVSVSTIFTLLLQYSL